MVNRIMVRHELMQIVRHGYLRKNLETIIVPSAEYPGYKRFNKDEFQYNGRRFDIVFEYHKNKTLIFRCINDKLEELITGLIKKTGRQQTHKNKLLTHLIIRALVTDYRPLFFNISHNFRYFNRNEFIAGTEPIPISPPPDCIS